MKITRFAVLLVGTCVFTTSASAQAPVAIVEDVIGPPPGVGFMDYVETGRIIRLGSRGSIVLNYMKSCEREVISGGTVTVGIDHSEVQSGKVERTKVDCDTGKMLLTSQQANETAGLVFRGLPPPAVKPATEPQFTLYGSCPIIELNGSGTLVIERLDKTGERYMLPIRQMQLVRGAFFDLAATGKSLAAGGVYRAAWGAQQVVFKVASSAKPGRTPIVGRLVILKPAI
jgi:hypothetical protein